jgi:hypothetical protein
MTRQGVEYAFNDDGVHSVDIVVKGPGVARLTRVSRPADVEALLSLLRGLVERDAEPPGGGEGVLREAAEAASTG